MKNLWACMIFLGCPQIPQIPRYKCNFEWAKWKSPLNTKRLKKKLRNRMAGNHQVLRVGQFGFKPTAVYLTMKKLGFPKNTLQRKSGILSRGKVLQPPFWLSQAAQSPAAGRSSTPSAPPRVSARRTRTAPPAPSGSSDGKSGFHGKYLLFCRGSTSYPKKEGIWSRGWGGVHFLIPSSK